MDEQALNDAYNLFTRQGYNGTIDQFKKLISTNSQALYDSYQIFRSEGYNGEIDNYKELVGVKKKASSSVSSPVSQVGMEDLQDGFDFSQPTFEAPSVLTPKAQEEYIAEQKTKPAPVVAKSPETSAVPKGWETYQAPTKEDEQGLGLNILSSLNRSIYKNFIGTPIKALGTFIEGTTSLLPRQIRSETGKGIISESLIDFGNYFNNAIDEISPQDKEFKDSLTDQFAQAFGQVASTILTAGVGTYASKGLPLLSKGASMLAKPLSARGAALAAAKEAGEQIVGPAGISSALTMGQSEYERAKQAGASDEQAYEAFYKNAVTGSVLETIPVMQFLKRFNTATNGGVLNYIKTKGVAGLTGGVEELTTEVLQTIYGNKTAQEIYNENQNLFEGVGTAGGIGFGVGFLLNAMGANAKILRKDGKNNEADVLENQIEALQSQAESGPPPVYKINGLKIESASIVNDMIERMDAPDLFKLNIEIDNDPVLKNKLQDKIVTSSIMEQVREANPELNEPSLKAITELEKQLTLLEGNKTQTGKDKAAAIRGQIKNIQENQLQEEAVAEVVVAEAPEIAQQRVDRIAEIETALSPESTIVIEDAEKIKLQTELETLKSEQDAIQKQTADEGVLRTEQPEMGLQQVGEGNLQPEVITAGTEEVIAPEGTQEIATQLNDLVNNFTIAYSQPTDTQTTSEKRTATKNANKAIKKLNDFFGFAFGGRQNEDQSKKQDALSNIKSLLDQNSPLVEFANINELMDAYNSDKQNNVESPLVKSVDTIFGITPAVSLETQPITRDNIRALTDEQIAPAYDEIPLRLMPTVEGVSKQDAVFEAYFKSKQKNTNPELVKAVEQLITQTQQNGQQEAGTTAGPIAGNRLFNKPLTKVKEIANRYYQRVFGTERPKFAGTRKLDEVRAKRISDAYIAMKNNPNNPKVKEAYEALAKETLDQYKDFLDAGFTVEINNEEAYANSQEMIEDLRNNNRIKIFSTESGFGSTPISNKQRKENPLLRDSGFKDVNGKTLLVNDVFRAIHDFYGHAELGNSFGAKGEENAWNVHARMFSPLARKAMTTETRGQNSYVNFSGVNERIEQLREDARKLREQGDEAGAQAIVDKIYQEGSFADQKIGLLPEEFFEFDEQDQGDISLQPQGLQARDTETVPAPIEEVVEEEQFVPLTASDIEFDIRFSRDEASDVVEDEREGDNGRSYTYLSEVETPVSDVDGEQIGYLVKMVDDDKNLSFEARDVDGNNLSKNEEGFGTLGEAKQALLNNHNKSKKKEFDREVKAKAKEKAKADAKAAKAKEKAKAKKPVKAEPVVTETIDDLLDLDVADQDNLDKIFNALDKVDKNLNKRVYGAANEFIIGFPLFVAQGVVKTLKALVKGGMLLRDAIKKVAADNNISQESVKDILNIAPIQEEFNSLMDKVDKLITRQKARGIQDSKITSNIDTFIRKQDEYLNANDAQKKIIEREARGKMGAAPKRAVSIGRVLGALKDITNISRQEKLKIISQIRQLSKDAAKDLAKEIRSMASSGRITANQAANIVARFGKVNMLSEISVSKFVDYMAKVFANAEYAAKLSQANRLKKDISKLSKNKDKNANLRDLAQKFIKIDPSMVEDIDAYNDMASKIKEAIKGSTIRGEKVKFADTVNIENATEYIDKTIDAQNEMMRQQKAEEIQDLMGVDVSDLSYEDMMQLLDSKEPITKYNEGIIRSTINKMFNIYSTLIETALDTGKDPFTDEDIEFTKTQKNLIRRFMDMDLTMLKPKAALQAVDALANFFQNQSTAKMEAVLSEYTGSVNAKKLVDDGIVAKQLKKYWSPKIGRFLGEQTTNLNILFERMFKGFNRGGRVEDAMGVTRLKNNKSMAQREANNIVEKYIAQFYKKTANGEAYNSEYNSVERGLAAFMMRNVIGTEKEMQVEFERRKRLIQESIEVLSEGNEKERAKAELYQTVYDNLIGPSKSFNENQKQSDEANSIQQVKDRVDPTNLEGIDFWNKEWADKYEQLADVSENIYNKVLDKDLNYTPDRFTRLSSDTGVVNLDSDESAFHTNSGTIYDRETGVLMTAKKPKSLPTNPENGEINRYIDLSFDKNNSNSMYDALVDINTAAPIKQIQGFLNSPDFKKIVPTAEDAKILKDRIQLYVGNIRNKNPYSNDELSSMVRGLNRIASIGVGQALGGVFQPVKQMIPVAMNTVINAGNLDIGSIFDSSKNAFINRSGFAISNRGIESQAQVESLNKLIDEASKTKGEKLIKNIEKLNSWWLENFLVKPDVFIARASWMTYYEQSLKKQGIDPKGIDYNTHDVNQEAAEYAQRMVDRQQNVSDSDLAGKMFSNKESSNQLIVKMLMPFASFRMNQSARFGSDLAVLSDKTATSEDKKIAIRSLSGFAVEMATFKMIAAGSAILLGSAAKWLMDDEEDEKDYKKRVNNVIKGQVTSSFNDVVSPLPILDKAFQAGGNFLTETMLDIPKESVFSIYDVPKQDYIQSLGLFGISVERAAQLYDITKLSTTGKYVDDFGNKQTISEEKQKALSYLIGPAILSNVGLAPVEVNSIVRNSIKSAKSKTSGDGALTRSALERWASSIDLSKMSKVAEFIKSKKEELSGKGDLAEKREFRKELEKDLLGKYEDKAQMRGADPELYKKNFGAESDWVKKGYAAEEILETKFNTILNKKKNLIKIEELKKQK